MYRDLFDVPEDVVYLNTASLAPRLRAVSGAGQAAIDRTARPWTIRSGNWFSGVDRLRQSFARLINAPASSVAVVPSVSYGIATAARNVTVGAGDNIVVLAQEYPSNYYSWSRLAREQGAELRVAERRADTTLTEAIVSLIDRRTSVVAVPNCHWTNGEWVDLRRISEAVKRCGAALVVDASQSLGALPLDIEEVQPDFLVCVGYKWLLGPYGLGYLYVAPRWHEHGRPLEESWLNRDGSENFASLVDYTDRYRAGAQRFGQGESAQFQLVPMALAALAQIEAWSVAGIQRHLAGWTSELCDRAAALGFTTCDASRRVGHMIGLEAEGRLPDRVAGQLEERNVHVAVRGACLRVAPHLHSTESDIERLIEALKEILR